MRYPVLYAPNEYSFVTSLGFMIEAVSCVVTEELNGAYELEMEYPVTGAKYSLITLSAVIMAQPADDEDPQPFRIYKISKPLKGVVTINAQHVSYQACFIPVMPFEANSAADALSGLINNSIEGCPFTTYTDVATAGEYKQEFPSSMRARIGGEEGSILEVFGGELKWDFYQINLLQNRGANRNVSLRYGKNVIDLKQEENIEETITGIVPYYSTGGDDNEVVTLPEKVVNSGYYLNYPYPRTIAVDLSGEFEETPTEADLRSKAQEYIAKNHIGVPVVSIDVSFVALWQTKEYASIAPLERVKLGDTVGVYFDKLGISTTAKVSKTEYDVLNDRYKSITIGDQKDTLANTLFKAQQNLNTEMNAVRQSGVSYANGIGKLPTDGNYILASADVAGNLQLLDLAVKGARDVTDKIVTGSTSVTVPANGSRAVTVSHDFGTTPKVFLSFGGNLSGAITSISNTGFTATINNSTSASITTTMYWLAL